MTSAEIKGVGLKLTLPRIKILEVLESHRGTDRHHMSAEDVYKALLKADEDIGLATIYRVLTQFETAGLVERHNFEGGQAVFEIKPQTHHDHMICTSCGSVQEFHNEEIERRQQVVAKQAGFKMSNHCLYIYGICSKCEVRLT